MINKNAFIDSQEKDINVISLIDCLLFDDKKFKSDHDIDDTDKDFLYYYNQYLTKENKATLPVITDTDLFYERAQNIFQDEGLKQIVIEKLEKDPKEFELLYNKFSKIREPNDNKISEQDEISKCVRSLKKKGIYKFENMFSDKQLDKICKFQKSITDTITSGNIEIAAGYITIVPAGGMKIGLQVTHEKVNYGLMRMQSKSMGGFHPGSGVIISDQRLNKIYQLWYNNEDVEISRATMDWLVPAPVNHNGWHIDILSNQLKAMVLLSDVTLDNGPMYYANGSHRIKNSFELKMKHATFIHGISKKHCLGERHGNNICAIEGGNVTYVSDDFVNNNPSVLDYENIVIDGQEYEKTVATGKRGDVIFFDSCGYHSGNICKDGMRLDIILSCPTESSMIGNFLKALGKNL